MPSKSSQSPWTRQSQLARILALRLEIERITVELRDAVIAARTGSRQDPPLSWAQIGEMLGVGATTAQDRYRGVAPVQRRRRPAPESESES